MLLLLLLPAALVLGKPRKPPPLPPPEPLYDLVKPVYDRPYPSRYLSGVLRPGQLMLYRFA